MNPPAPQEEALAHWLRSCDEALADGRPMPEPTAGVVGEFDPETLACLRMLDRLRPPEPTPDHWIGSAPSPAAPGGQFQTAVRESGVVEPAAWNSYCLKVTSTPDPPATPEAFADRAVTDGMLTKFQADRILSGRSAQLLLCGRYRVLDELGAGGMGQVFLAEHAIMRHKVALKLLPPSRAGNAAAVERFRREARAVAALSHPNIVRALEMDRDGGTDFLVMEYVVGTTLQDLVRRNGPLDVRSAAGYAAQVADALQHAHERGLVHRDVKPANLIVDADGAVKVLDLGLARFFLDGADGLGSTEDGLGVTGEGSSQTVLGTVDYMAPEQSHDSRGVDIRADIYALGCTLYHLLTGTPPFQGKSVAQKLICHQLRKPEPIRSVRPDVPNGLAVIVGRMMAKDPVDRYQIPADVATALRPWAGEQSPDTEPTVRRRRSTVAACLVSVVVAVVGACATFALRTPDVPADSIPAKVSPAAVDQVEAVRRELVARNPGFNGTLSGFSYPSPRNNTVVVAPLRVDDGRITSLGLCADAVGDITPLGSLTSLERLVLRGTVRTTNGAVVRLDPLRGLPLKALDVSNNGRLDNLQPLIGMRLEAIWFGGTRVADLSPLRGMPLREVYAGNSKVADLSPLRGTQLSGLSVRNTPVADLGPVRGAPLQMLRCDHTEVRDLTPLAKSPLQFLSCRGAPIASLAPLADSPLEELEFDFDWKRDADLPRLLPHLKKINDKPAAEFWVSVGLAAQNGSRP